MANFPDSYRDPLYDQLDAANEEKMGLPVGLLSSIRTAGEKSNHDQVSSAGAASVYQIIPATRDAAIKKFGVDPMLSPENASEVAGLLLKESLKRNKGDASAAVGEYIGGTNRENWGKVTNAYINRVMTKQQGAKKDALSSGFAAFMAANPAIPDTSTVPAAQQDVPVEGKKDALAAGFGKWLESGEPLAPAQAPAGEQERVRGSAGEEGLRSLGLTARYGLEGVTAGAGVFTDPIIQAAGGAIRAVTGSDYNPATLASVGTKAANALGLPSPEGSQERLVGALTRGVAGGATGAGAAAALGKVAAPGLAGTVLENLAAAPVAQAAAGGAAGLASQGVAEVGGSPLAQLGASLVAGVAAPVAGIGAARAIKAARAPAPAPIVNGAAPDAVDAATLTAMTKQATESLTGKKQATQNLADQTLPDQKTIAAAKRLGIEEHLQPDHVTTSQAYRELAQAVKSIPGSQGRVAELEGLEAVGKRASSLIDEYGGSRDLSTLDSGLKERMTQNVDELATKADKVYADLRSAIPAREQVETPNILSFIEKRAADLGGVKNLSPTEKMILGKLAPKKVTTTENIPGNPLMPGSQSAGTRTVESTTNPTYALLDDVRRDLTAARIQRAGPFKDADTGLIKILEANLKTDQRAVVERFGKLPEFEAARTLVAVRKGIERDMAALFGKNLTDSIVGKLQQGVAALPKGDATKLVKFIKAVPESMRSEVVASGLSTAFNVSSKNQNPSFANYVNFYEGLLKNKQSAAVVFSNLPPQARKQMSDLYRVSKGISSATRERITTGRINAIRDDFRPADNLGARLYDAAKHQIVAVGAGAATGVAASTVLGPAAGSAVGAAVSSALARGAKPKAIEAADRLITSPEFLAAVKRAQNGYTREAARQFAATRAFKAFVKTIKNPRVAGNPEAFVFDALTANQANQEAKKPRNKGN